MLQATKYISAKNISRKAIFPPKRLYVNKKYFKIFERMFLWASVIPDTPFRAGMHSLHRFSNGFQTSY